MENQTRYDLNAAVENWQTELAAQANLTPDVRRELETHLRDAIAGFQQSGLNDEESFWLARRRVGQPQQLGEEFVKADSTGAWRERAFWLAFGLLILRLGNMLLFSIFSPTMFGAAGFRTLGEGLPKSVAFYVPEWMDKLPFMDFFQFFSGLTDQLFALAVIFFWRAVRWKKCVCFLNLPSRTGFSFSALCWV